MVPPQPGERGEHARARRSRSHRLQRTMGRVRRRVTFSRNLTLSLSRTCRCYCKYCAFATHQPHLHEPAEVERILDGAVKRNVKELLVLTGEAPDHHPGVAAKLAELGHADFTAYVVWVCERALERGLLPHTNLGVLSREDLGRLREVTASQGLMLESVNPDLVAHQGSPTKHPELPARVHPHRRRAEDPVHERDPRRHRRERGRARRGARGARRRARRARPPAGGDPAELRPAPELLRARAGRDRRGGRRRSTGAPASARARSSTAPRGRRRSASRT